jgi:hypothetical protein
MGNSRLGEIVVGPRTARMGWKRELMAGSVSRSPVAQAPPLRHSSTRKFDAVLTSQGLPGRVVELPESTRTAAEAARAVGCELRQIVKSLVFQTARSKQPVLLLVSGANRVDEAWMARYVGQTLARADPELVRSKTVTCPDLPVSGQTPRRLLAGAARSR